MLSARAYSFRQQSRLAISLSWVGGYTNVVALLACGQVVSHMTGPTTSFAIGLADGAAGEAVYLGFILGCFLFGAVASACITEGARRRGMRSKFILPLAVEVVLLTLFALGVHAHQHVVPTDLFSRYWMTGAAATAMGLQNATITRVSGSVIRTTHLTGVITDIGLEGVQLLLWYWDTLRGRWASRAGRVMRVTQRHPSFLRVALLMSIFCSFLFGAAVGALIFERWPAISLVPPVLFLIQIIVIDWRTPIADVREMDLLNDPELKAQGIVKALLPPGVGIYRFTGVHGRASHRAPNFQLWVDHVPRHWKLVVLAISPLTRFNDNAVLDLQQAVKKLSDDGRQLIISGITPAQFRALDALGVARIMDANNLCPDLEFAIARVMTIVNQRRAEPTGEAAIAT